MIGRRAFLAGAGSAALLPALRLTAAGTPADLVESVEQVVIRRSGDGRPTWFSARACMTPGRDCPVALMTLQPIYGSDFFGQVHWMESADLGRTWTDPQPIAAFARRKIAAGLEEGVCDVVPEYHPRTSCVLAVGHNVFYKPKGFYRPQPPRWPVYAVRSSDGTWSAAERLLWDDPRTTDIYTCNCAQRVNLPDGRILIPLSLRPQGRADAGATTVRCTFDGVKLTIVDVGNELRLPTLRGLLEPSLAALDGRYYMTIRAEDNRGYVSTSEDGLRWAPIEPWRWDDGEALEMSTTQQRWLPHSDGLHLVYTRRTPQNDKVIRWRSPLFMAQVDLRTRRLIRASERVAMPLEGDPANEPKRVPHLGNFHTVAASPQQSWVTVGAFDITTWAGNLQMARIRWKRPNRLASAAGVAPGNRPSGGFGAAFCGGAYEKHLQGICTDDRQSIFWCFTTRLVKTDPTGRVLKEITVASHHGDLCHRDGLLYVAVNLGKFNAPPGKADSWVYVYRADDLREIARHRVPELVHGAGGMACRGKRFYVVGGLPPAVNENYVYEYDEEFRFLRRHVIASGYTLMGIQTAAYADGGWWFGCYGLPKTLLHTDGDFRLLGKHVFDAAYGLVGLPDGRFLVARSVKLPNKQLTAEIVTARADAAEGLKVEE